MTISDYLGLFWTIWYFLGLSWTRVQVEAGESKFLLFETFSLFFIFTCTSCRGARAPKNQWKSFKKQELVFFFLYFHPDSISSCCSLSIYKHCNNLHVMCVTKYFLPDTCYLILGTWYLFVRHVSWYLLLDTCYLTLVAWPN